MRAAALPALVRPFTLIAPPLGVIAGALVAHAVSRVAIDAGVLVTAVVSALLATCASNAWNHAFDVEIDRRNKPRRPIPAGLATEREAILLGHACALAALFAGYLTSPWFFVCVAAGVLATWIYSAPPLRTKRRTWGALLTIAIPRGALVPVAGWAVVQPPLTPEPWTLGVVAGLFIFGAAVTKDFADVEGDREHGCRTLPVAWGPERAARFTAPFLVAPFLLYPLAGVLGLLTPPTTYLLVLAGLLAVPGAIAGRLLVRDPAGLAVRGGNHPAWVVMYLLLLGVHALTAGTYLLAA
jgi:chlorophyll synthase